MGNVTLACSASIARPWYAQSSPISFSNRPGTVTFVVDVRGVCHADPELLRQVFVESHR
jgi:hypothetical protein